MQVDLVGEEEGKTKQKKSGRKGKQGGRSGQKKKGGQKGAFGNPKSVMVLQR